MTPGVNTRIDDIGVDFGVQVSAKPNPGINGAKKSLMDFAAWVFFTFPNINFGEISLLMFWLCIVTKKNNSTFCDMHHKVDFHFQNKSSGTVQNENGMF